MSYPGELVPTVTDNSIESLSPIGDRYESSPDVARVAPDPRPSPKPERPSPETIPPQTAANEVGDAIEMDDPVKLKNSLADLRKAPASAKIKLKKFLDQLKIAQDADEKKFKKNTEKPPDARASGASRSTGDSGQLQTQKIDATGPLNDPRTDATGPFNDPRTDATGPLNGSRVDATGSSLNYEVQATAEGVCTLPKIGMEAYVTTKCQGPLEEKDCHLQCAPGFDLGDRKLSIKCIAGDQFVKYNHWWTKAGNFNVTGCQRQPATPSVPVAKQTTPSNSPSKIMTAHKSTTPARGDMASATLASAAKQHSTPAPAPICPEDMRTPRKRAWGDDVSMAISGTCRVVIQLDMPPYERAPLNQHFNAYARDRSGGTCSGLVMRLRKHCGEAGHDPQACSLPLMGFDHPYIATRAVRSVRMSGNRATLDAYGQRKRIEWFEENAFTRNIKGHPELNFNECGCKDDESRWMQRDQYTESWYVEFSNENPDPTNVCAFTFKPSAVDVCSGHGIWRVGDGCFCDKGYDGQYQGSAEVTEKQTGDYDYAEQDGVNEQGTHTLNTVKKVLNARTGNFPIEAAPGEIQGQLGSQNSHNLGCRIADSLSDDFVKHQEQLARKRAGQTGKYHTPSIGKNLTVDSTLDDCTGVMTPNLLWQMSNDQVVACTGRTKEEMITGLEGSTPNVDVKVDLLLRKRPGYWLSKRADDGFGYAFTKRIVIGRAAESKFSEFTSDALAQTSVEHYGTKKERLGLTENSTKEELSKFETDRKV